MTNGDRIRQMSNEELAEILKNEACDYCVYKTELKYCRNECGEGIKAYLESEEQ